MLYYLLGGDNKDNLKGMAAPEAEVEALPIVLDGEEIDGASTGLESVLVDADSAEWAAYNVLSMPISPDYRGIVIRNGKKIKQ